VHRAQTKLCNTEAVTREDIIEFS